MKTKQANMKAVFTKKCDNAVNHGGKMETVNQFVLVDKKTEKQVVVVRTYMGRGRSASQVKAAIWVTLSDKKKTGWMGIWPHLWIRPSGRLWVRQGEHGDRGRYRKRGD